jgi:glycogen phosphorylase
MKAALNGVLNCSIRDGWWDEWSDGQNGWDIATHDEISDLVARDKAEADSLFRLFEDEIVPLFYDRPESWWRKVTHNWASLGPKVTASRMVREYTERLYEPAAAQADAAASDNSSIARSLAAWKPVVRSAWPTVAVTSVDVDVSPATIGESRPVIARVQLGTLTTSDVRVEAVHGRLNDAGDIVDAQHTPMAAENDGTWTATVVTGGSGRYGVGVRVLPHHVGLATPVELGLVTGS